MYVTLFYIYDIDYFLMVRQCQDLYRIDFYIRAMLKKVLGFFSMMVLFYVEYLLISKTLALLK